MKYTLYCNIPPPPPKNSKLHVKFTNLSLLDL